MSTSTIPLPAFGIPTALTCLRGAEDLNAGRISFREFLQRQSDEIRAATDARASAIVVRDLVCTSGMNAAEAAPYEHLFAHPQKIRKPAIVAQPIPRIAGPSGVYLIEPADFSAQADTWLTLLTEQLALVCEHHQRVGTLQSKLTGLETAVEKFQADLKTEVEERRVAELALHESNGKLTEWVYELEQRNRDMALLKEITDLIQTCLSTEETNLLVSEYLPRLFDGNSGAICLSDSDAKFVETVTSWGDTEGWEAIFLPEHCWSLRRARAHCVKGSQRALRCSHFSGRPPAWYLCLPLIAHGQAIGLLHLNSRRSSKGQLAETLSLAAEDSAESELSPYKQQLAETAAEQLGMALANLQLREALRTQAVRDPLTGLFNRRYMEEALTREVHRTKRSGGSFGCMMLDLDHFKKFNDTYGHAAGDMLLRQVGLFLQRETRSSDIVCRYGGEEFTVILPDASLDATQRRAEAIRAGISKLTLDQQLRDQPPTVSIGVAALPDHGADAESVLRAADRGLYQAKSEGRNRVHTAGPSSNAPSGKRLLRQEPADNAA